MNPDWEPSSLRTSRRRFIRTGLLAAAAAPALAAWPASAPQGADQQPASRLGLPEFTGPELNPFWNSVGPLVTQPQKLLWSCRTSPYSWRLRASISCYAFYAERSVLRSLLCLETATTLRLERLELHVEGNVEKPLTLSLPIFSRFLVLSVAAVNQCSGNSCNTFSTASGGRPMGQRSDGQCPLDWRETSRGPGSCKIEGWIPASAI